MSRCYKPYTNKEYSVINTNLLIYYIIYIIFIICITYSAAKTISLKR